MRVAVVHNAVAADSPPDERDVLSQVSAVQDALEALGHEAWPLPCSLDLESVRVRLEAERPDLVFNLVESLNGKGRLIHLFPAMLDSAGFPYTGSKTEAIWLTSHKVMAKERLAAAGLPTPYWVGPDPAELPPIHRPQKNINGLRQTWIVKSLWEHASVGLEGASIIDAASEGRVLDELRLRSPLLGGACFGEVFIEGREFNLSVLAGPDGPQVLPPAEILFEGYGSRPRIVGYRAKWQEDSYEYSHTPRRFDFGPDDLFLLSDLKDIAARCWQLFALKGYARIDFRVDEKGRPFILEINANPCLSPDAGFAAATARQGMTIPQTIERILEDATGCRPPSPQALSPLQSPNG